MSPRSLVGRSLMAMLTCAAVAAQAATAGRPDDVGESIYRLGIDRAGRPVVAVREGGMRAPAKDAACVNCHRRSGLGSKEGREAVIPPITGRYLFETATEDGTSKDLPFVETMRNGRAPYDRETLARAIREGVDSQGRPLSYLMPRFDLGDADMAALIKYLESLDHRNQPGVTDTELHFATIVTPDADPVKRRGVLDVLQHYFEDRNKVQMAPGKPLRSSRRMMFMVHRRWQLHVWELTGPADTWRRQLDQHLAAEPVLAVISGIGGRNWQPVQNFCEERAVPCLFPNVEVPPADADRDFYPVYFSRGLLLEADLIARSILEKDVSSRPKVVRQIYRAGDNGAAAAATLANALRGHGIVVRDEALPPGKPLAEERERRGAKEALVLWLRPADLEQLGETPPSDADLYVSGLMGGLETAPLPQAWRERAQIAYTFDLPDKRRVRVDYPLGWFRIRHIPVVDEQTQTDTYLACGLVAEALHYMSDSFIRDYLVERVQDGLAHRIITGYYPRLALAKGQRFASKGGYLVRFAGASGHSLVAVSDWVAP